MINKVGSHHNKNKLKRKGKNLKKMSKNEKRQFFTKQSK